MNTKYHFLIYRSCPTQHHNHMGSLPALGRLLQNGNEIKWFVIELQSPCHTHASGWRRILTTAPILCACIGRKDGRPVVLPSLTSAVIVLSCPYKLQSLFQLCDWDHRLVEDDS